VKKTGSLLAAIVLADLTLRAGDEPGFAFPTNDSPPAAGRLVNLVAAPAITNWPAENKPPPQMTNWPATNVPSMTNPPVLHPPGRP
jgi:hypothetical protein